MKDYLILIRPYGILFLGFTPVFCAIAAGENSLIHLSILLIIGLLIHIFTFVQNDFYDVEIDKKSTYVSDRPYVKCNISTKKIKIIIASSFLLCLIISMFIFSFYSFIMLILSFILISLYNKFSKKISGMEYILSVGVFTFGLFGAYSVTNNISYFVLIVCFFGFFQWLFSVGISANLKDVEFDSKIDIKTTPIRFDVKVIDNNLHIPVPFYLYAFGIKIIHILVTSLILLFGYSTVFINGLPIIAISFFIISFILIYLIWKILSTDLKNRDKMLIYAGLQEGLTLILLPITLLNYLIEKISLLPTLFLLILFILWPILCFRLLFGKKMIPLE